MRVTVLNPAPQHGTAAENNPALTVRDLAVELRRSERTIRKLIADYHIPPAGRYGRAFAYWTSDLIAADRDTRKRQLLPLARRWKTRPAYLEPVD